ncbi:MFS transporter [Rudaeicoccus suwonensis]|uniref:Putative MFS family arabinose efflux permease n=1 Tax=Rudaeicoccus suwonensis TaxID=657409 RepID=A0A561E9T7_9MICO|nr:MFS transporter [Rudaeicoccus suwonensis]TWE12383.1 putative MFS family arabinose efflux permease [Rudaeicoccus suwonensis]
MNKWAAALPVLRERNFRWFFLSRSINTIGGMMTPVTIAFAVLTIDNSPQALGIVVTAEMGMNVLCLLFGGVIADRLPRRTVMQTCYLVMAAVQLTLVTLLAGGWATVLWMSLLGAVAGGASAFSMPAQQGLIPQLVAREHLQQADSLMSFVRNGATFIGPVIGTLLVASLGLELALAVDGASFLVAAALLARVMLPPAARAATSLFGQLREGWNEFRSRSWLWVVVLAFGVLNAIQIGVWVVVGPTVAKNNPSLGISGWGIVLGAEAIGMLVMSVVLMRVHIHRLLLDGMAGVSLIAIPLLLLGIHPHTVPLAVAAFVGGAGTQVFSTAWTVAMMERIPSAVLSRVSSYDMLGSFIAIPVGTMAFGYLASHVQIRPLLIIAGSCYAVVALSTLLVPSVRSLTRLPAATAAEADA